MRRIIVTGAKGGTGRSIVRVLREAGYDAFGLDVKAVEAGDKNYAQVDVTDAARLRDVLRGADGVVHFGSLPTDEGHAVAEVFQNVTGGGFNVLNASADAGIKRVVLASSMEVYGDLFKQPHLPVTEQSPLAPRSIYGASKVLLEQLASDYCRWHGMSIAAFRLGRIVYEECFDSRLKRHTESDASAANVLWCYVDARDVATACQAWLESDVRGFRPFNVAVEDVCVETPTRELLAKFYSHVADRRAAFDDHQTPFDSTALRAALGWKARYSWKAIRDEWTRSRKDITR